MANLTKVTMSEINQPQNHHHFLYVYLQAFVMISTYPMLNQASIFTVISDLFGLKIFSNKMQMAAPRLVLMVNAPTFLSSIEPHVIPGFIHLALSFLQLNSAKVFYRNSSLAANIKQSGVIKENWLLRPNLMK